jgi:NitT/TauT family transport system substrate-binding protein
MSTPVSVNQDVKRQAARNRITGLVAAVAGIVLAAASSSTAWAQSAAKTSKITKIRVASTDTLVNATPYFVANKLGYFKEAGIEVEFFTMSGGAAPLAAAMKSKEIDVSIGAASQFMTDVARGIVQGKLIGQFVDSSYNIVGGKGITDIKQLKGKIFGVVSHNSGDQIYCIAVLKHFGIDKDDVTWLPLGSPPARLAALRTGRVDAIEIEDTVLPDSLRNSVIIGSDKSPVKFAATTIFSRQDFIDANRPALSAFLSAIGRGADWVRANPAAALPICVHDGASAAACASAIKVGTSSKNPYTWSSSNAVNVAAIEEMIPHIATVVPQAAKMSVSDFVDSTLANAKR